MTRRDERRTETGRLHPRAARPAGATAAVGSWWFQTWERKPRPGRVASHQESEGGVSARALAGFRNGGRRNAPSLTGMADLLIDGSCRRRRDRPAQPSRARVWLRFRSGARRRKGACDRPDETRQVCGEAGVDRWSDPDSPTGDGNIRCSMSDRRCSDGPADRLDAIYKMATGRFVRSRKCRRARVHRVRRGRPSRSPERRT
jgi:hypothetical protein